MKTNLLLAGSVLLTLTVSCESVPSIIAKILELLGLVGPFASKFAAGVSLFTWLASSVLVLAHNALWDCRFLAFVVLHAALWFAKVFLLAAVFSGYGK